MKFFNKKLDKKDLEELQARNRIIGEYNLVVQALELQRTIWLNSKLKDLGVDLTKRYSVDKNGIIKEDELKKNQGKP